jgi:diaminohydroxyphosphoribosylaminopyrimidine deaminase / 5-amino-6-(5-phosphoribosylamino)uracil reductase
LHRACELAERGAANVSPNPPVGAVIVRDGRTLGEGFHHRRGEAHAEVEALRRAGDVSGGTLYVSLEPCNHHGRTAPCTEAIVERGIARVVIGALDPNPKTDGGGVGRLRAAGVEVEVAADPWAADLIEKFAKAIRTRRPFVTLKMASSLDGYVAPHPGSHWLTGERSREFVRLMRATHDAVLVGAGTVRVDDPQLTTRPHYTRRIPYRRVVACETDPVDVERRIFSAPADAPDAFAPTIVLAPRGAAARFAPLEAVADVVYVGGEESSQLDLGQALEALKSGRGIESVLCEGGPTLAGRMLAGGLVDRVVWLIAPVLLRNERAVPVLAGADLATGLQFERSEMLGEDLLLSAKVEHV